MCPAIDSHSGGNFEIRIETRKHLNGCTLLDNARNNDQWELNSLQVVDGSSFKKNMDTYSHLTCCINKRNIMVYRQKPHQEGKNKRANSQSHVTWTWGWQKKTLSNHGNILWTPTYIERNMHIARTMVAMWGHVSGERVMLKKMSHRTLALALPLVLGSRLPSPFQYFRCFRLMCRRRSEGCAVAYEQPAHPQILSLIPKWNPFKWPVN